MSFVIAYVWAKVATSARFLGMQDLSLTGVEVALERALLWEGVLALMPYAPKHLGTRAFQGQDRGLSR